MNIIDVLIEHEFWSGLIIAILLMSYFMIIDEILSQKS